MISYVPINKTLSLIIQEINPKQTVQVIKKPTSHIWVYDRSGSMGGNIKELCNQLIALSKKLPKNDYLTLGWFSSENGQYNWIIKGFRICDTSDYKMLEKLILENNYTIGCTCFSEILADTKVVIKDLSAFTDEFSFHFFTDGYPVVSNYQKEIAKIFEAIGNIKGKIKNASLVGYGSYYNKELMSQMATNLGAALIHSSQISEYTKSILNLISLTQNSQPKEKINPAVTNPISIFTIIENEIIPYSIEADKTIYVNPVKGSSSFIYYVTEEKPDKKHWTKIDPDEIHYADEKDNNAKAMYAASLILSQSTKTDMALDILGCIGDASIIDKLSNAFQIEEFGNAENIIKDSVFNIPLRFVTGRKANYVPPKNAFCVFNVLDILINDEEAAFFPYHPKFCYEKISLATKEKSEYATFKPDRTSKSFFNNLIWHESRLNLSIQTKITGSIDLQPRNGMTAQLIGLQPEYPCYVYRNYTFVKDGHTHIKQFYLTSSEPTYRIFKNFGIVIDDTFHLNRIYGLEISALPTINREIAESKTSGTDLCQSIIKEQKLKAKIKSLKYLHDIECPEEATPLRTFTDVIQKFIEDNGIDIKQGGLYSPPTTKEESKDFYMAKSFDIATAGIASLPTVKKVMEKIAANKARTPVELLLEEGITLWEANKKNILKKDDKEKWFNDNIRSLKNELKTLRHDIQLTKFAVILGHKWFKEFTSRENCEIVVDDIKCSFKLSEEKVPY